MIQTVTGSITPEQLGRTFSHEHFFFGYPGYEYDISSRKFITKESVMEKCIIDAKVLAEQGMNTVIDGTPMDCGRNPEWLKEISEASGLQIVCATGYYLGGISATGYWNLRAKVSDAANEYAELLINELTEGIGDTGIKAGFVKLAVGHDKITEYQKIFISGAVKAQKETGCVIYAHTENGELSYELAKLLLWYGADPSKCVIGHMCGLISPSRHLDLMLHGFNVGFDRIGLYDDQHAKDKERARTMEALIRAGMTDRILISSDNISQILGRPVEMPNKEDWVNSYFGYINEKFIPYFLENFDVRPEDIEKILVENPRRIFG